jgi:hypothetical protein
MMGTWVHSRRPPFMRQTVLSWSLAWSYFRRRSAGLSGSGAGATVGGAFGAAVFRASAAAAVSRARRSASVGFRAVTVDTSASVTFDFFRYFAGTWFGDST